MSRTLINARAGITAFRKPGRLLSFLLLLAAIAWSGIPATGMADTGSAAAPAAAPVSGEARGIVVVAGATGRTGRHVVATLKEQGYGVRALVRDAAAARSLLGEGVEYVVADVRQPVTLAPAMTGAAAVISALGSGRKVPGNGPEQVDYEGVKNLAEAAAAARVGQIVLVSSAGVTQEDHPLNRMFDNVLRWKAKGEEAVRASGVPFTIVRPGGLVDKPGGEGGIRLEQGDRGSGFIPRADVARVCVAALESPAARNRTFELYSGPGAPPADWDAVFGALGE
jgi:uncharacterized protein YbjT (DUF2867 family)